MADLIDRERTYKVLVDYYHIRMPIQLASLREALNRVPTAEPKRGHNLADEQPRLARIFYCSECGYGFNDIFLCNEADYPIEPNYCPNCGVRMDEVEE